MGDGGVAGLTEIKANSASQQSWSSDLAELGKNITRTFTEEELKVLRETLPGTYILVYNCI